MYYKLKYGEMTGIQDLLKRTGLKLDLRELVGYSTSTSSALHEAAREGLPSVVLKLLDAKASVNQVTEIGGTTPLHAAASGDSCEMVVLLLQAQATLNLRD